jgi:hypothetical protein
VKIEYDQSGRSEGSATVMFGSKSDAERAVKTFNGRTLDDTKVGHNENALQVVLLTLLTP